MLLLFQRRVTVNGVPGWYPDGTRFVAVSTRNVTLPDRAVHAIRTPIVYHPTGRSNKSDEMSAFPSTKSFNDLLRIFSSGALGNPSYVTSGRNLRADNKY